ncbi:hypothetical protein ACCT30_24805, partial [Rhizobium ruizarguesonis]
MNVFGETAVPSGILRRIKASTALAGKLVPLLAAAIDRKLVSLVYQPIFDVTNGKARAVEA